ncbi:hypothetical protein RHSIM_Rhsim03G0095300 [Rhododendron simsii]|uniref:Uncharacterized protein n=1 Tax=Rhododendron simsii TaxID=118357 RepID=A0A834LRG4_RHOSS|nr:hypothetical protein RHSIM_Rhsim03G0095300 [Rhododendron simsii]
MWKLKIAEGKGPYLFSTNNYVGKQILEFDPDAGTSKECEADEQARQEYKDNFKKGRTRAPPCVDLLMRMQLVVALTGKAISSSDTASSTVDTGRLL